MCSIGLRRDGRFAEGVLVRLMAFQELGSIVWHDGPAVTNYPQLLLLSTILNLYYLGYLRGDTNTK